MTEQELKDFLEQETQKMDIGNLKLYATHAEIMRMIDMARRGYKVDDK